MTLSFRLSSDQWLTDAQWERLLKLLSDHHPAVDELSLFTREQMGWFGTMDVMAPEAAIMARRIEQAHAAGFYSAGINVLSTLGHGDPVGEWSPEFTLPRAMGHDGSQATHCPCPNAAPFREHIKAKYQLFAQARPDFIWVDDDLRGSHHGPLYTCYCPICLEKFGRGLDRAELVQRLNDPAESDLRRDWVAFNAATLTSVCQDIGDAIRAFDPRIKIGLMTIGSSHSTHGGHALLDETAALGATKGRPGHGFYWDDAPRGIFNKALDVGRQCRDYAPAVVDVQYELENYPYIALDKADRTVLNEVYLAIMMGCNGVAFNALKDTAGTLEDFEPLVAAIAAERPAWEALIAHTAGLPIAGFWCADDNALMGKHAVDEKGWFWEGGVYDIQRPNPLAEMGVALSPTRALSCGTLLAGKIAEAFSDMELRAILGRGVLLDSYALEVLWARGLGELAGAKPGKHLLGGAVETLTDHPLNTRFAGDSRDGLLQPADNTYALELLPGAQEAARIVGYDGRDHGTCLSVFTNALGGRVAVSTYAPWRRLGRLCKRSQLTELADWLAYGKLPVRIDAFRRVAPFMRVSEDGKRFACVLLNSTLDTAWPFDIRIRTTAPRAELLTPNGPLPLTVQDLGDELKVHVPAIAPWHPLVIIGG